jgi:competence protein ComEC
VIATHPHTDHTRCLSDVFARFRVRNFVDNGEMEDGGGLNDLLGARAFIDERNNQQPGSIIYNRVDAEDITSAGYKTQWFKDLKNSASNVDIIFLNGSRDCKNPNNDSLVVLVKYKTTKFLIAGDAEWDDEGETCVPAIPRMLGKFTNSNLLNVDVYKVGHHGSPNGTNTDYLTRMSPKISVISAGARNDGSAKIFGHPRQDAVEQLVQFTSQSRPNVTVYTFDRGNGNIAETNLSKAVYCTCWDGDIVISRTANNASLKVVTN